jgi:photosystem II stability/assembly factor-like uncharacterized protein
MMTRRPTAVVVCVAALVAASISQAVARGEASAPSASGRWVSLGPDGGPVLALAIDPTDPTVIDAGSQLGTVYKSENGGARWHPLGGGLPGGGIGALAIDPIAPNTVYAGTWREGVFKSTDAGATWVEANTGLPEEDLAVSALVVDPSDPSTLYVSVSTSIYWEGTVYRSTDGATTWSDAGFPGPAKAIAVDSADPSRIYAGHFRSQDGGATWTRMVFDDHCDCGKPTAFALDPTTPGVLFAALDQGLIYSGSVQRTTDDGATWEEVLSTDPVVSLVSAPSSSTGPSALYAGTGQYAPGHVHKSVDGGMSWLVASNGLPTGEVRSLAVDPRDPQHVYAGSIEGGVSETRDGAASWRLRNRGFREEGIVALAVSPSTPSTIYAGTNVGGSGNGVHRGVRRGTRWGPIQPGGLTDEERVSAIAVDPLDPNTLLVGTHHGCDCDNGSVDLSTDGGLTWREVSPTT